MAGITREIAEARLQEYLDAEAQVLSGQEVWHNNRRLTRADLETIQKGITTWNERVKQLAGTGGRVRFSAVTPR